MHAKRWFLASLVLAGAALPCFADGGTVRVVVGFKGSADADTVKAGGGDVLGTVGGDAVVAEIPAGKVNALRANASVAYVEEDGYAEAFRGPPGSGGGSEPPAQPSETTPWGVSKIVHGDTAHDGSGIDVAVIDTGIDVDHPDLVGNYAGGKTFVTRTSTPNDDNGHGSHVAGTIGAVPNDIGVVGVAPACNLWAVKVLDKRGSGYWSDVAAGIDWTRTSGNSIRVANMSLGGGDASVVRTACDNAYAAGVLLFAASGNSGDGNTTTTETSYPAAYSSVAAVGATTQSDGLASFSNTGSYVEFSGPGYQVPSTYKDGGYATLSGTSMACPHAVGMAARLWDHIGGGAANVRTELRHYTVDLGPSGRDNGFGYGRVDVTYR